jgi:hypothetical protein
MSVAWCRALPVEDEKKRGKKSTWTLACVVLEAWTLSAWHSDTLPDKAPTQGRQNAGGGGCIAACLLEYMIIHG